MVKDDSAAEAGRDDDVARMRPHERLIDGSRELDALVALHTLYAWYRERSARSPEANAEDGESNTDDGEANEGGDANPFGRSARTVIDRLGDRLGLRLLEQGTSTGGFWGLTEEGKRLAIVAQQLLATLDHEVTDILEGRARNLNRRRHINVGCFNAQVKLYLAAALGSLRANKAFDYDIRFNADMNIRTVNARVILDDVGRDRGDPERDRGLYRIKGFHYGVVPWVDGTDPHKEYPKKHYNHLRLYGWRLLVIAPEESPLRRRPSVDLIEVVNECCSAPR